MIEVLNNFIDRLTSNYNKDKNSNVHKLMEVAANHIQENEDLLNQIRDWRDIDQAQGEALNKVGRNVQQNRGQATDSVYRILIKSKIKRNLSNGSVNTLIDFLSFILQIDKNLVTINELWQTGTNATLSIDCPADDVNKTGLTVNQFGTLINLVVSAGVKANVLFEGTFELTETHDTVEYYYVGPGMFIANDAVDVEFGFADTNQTIGGKLGKFYDPTLDYELPY